MKSLERMERFSELSVAIWDRFLQTQSLDDELAELRRRRKMWINMIVARKMYARTLEQVYINHQLRKTQILRSLHLVSDDADLLNELEMSRQIVIHLMALRRENGRWLLNIGRWMERWNIQLTDAELRTTLTISEADWRENEDRLQNRTIEEVTLRVDISDQAFCNQVMDEMANILFDVG